MARILVLEDDQHIRELVCLHLGIEGFACTAVGDGRDALRLAEQEQFDLLVLDVMTPGLDGVTVCRAVRRTPLNGGAPILMLTARREESDAVLGLESGADDYLTKPFGVREFVARVRALLRRGRAATAAASDDVERPLVVHGIEIDPARRRVRVDGEDIDLTPLEFRLLHFLAARPGLVFPRATLITRLWGADTHVTPRSVDTLVKRLRRRIEPAPDAPRYLLTVRGVGYKFADV
jgi:two-component system OmpR family response regulator/two-component system alkaline phosphatase synthesis response regulator PhoP